MSFSLDFLKLLGDEHSLFPRKLMTNTTKGQVIIYDEDELVENVRRADFLDCYIQTHTADDRENGELRLVFIDIDDKAKNLDRAKKVTERILHYLQLTYNIKPYCQFSGNKGYHILIPIKTVWVPNGLVKDYLAYLQTNLSKGYCDSSILGDVVKLWRLPHTFNSRGIRRGIDGEVNPIQDWDGTPFDSESLYNQFQLTKLEEGLRTKTQKNELTLSRQDYRLRREVNVLIERAKQGLNLTHSQRLAVLFEMINNKFSDRAIQEVFSHVPDYDKKVTQYHIDYARRGNYRPFRTETLKRIM